ncbi:hypothetical protein J6590_006572 [Homalodisca vitripennis]|nr:hypothetical protein J6590_006572 [Homalodisca vitripennis]
MLKTDQEEKFSPLVKEQVFSSFLLLTTHTTKQILRKNVVSVKMIPEVIMFVIRPITREPIYLRREGQTLLWGKSTVGPFCSFSDPDAASTFSRVQRKPIY